MFAVERDQVLAFRLAGHHLDARTDPLSAVAACGIQDYPPGWAAVALHARTAEQLDPEAVVTVNAMRGAPYIVPRADRAVFTTALVPPDEAGLRALVGGRVPRELEAHGLSTTAALEHVGAAARDALAAGPLERDAFHQALRERLAPFGEALLPWCRGCQSHHVAPGLWRALGPLGVTEMPAKATWALAEAPLGGPAPPAVPARAPLARSAAPAASAREAPGASAELVRRFLRGYGPATHTQLAAWAQMAPAHARRLFAGVGEELAAVSFAGRQKLLLEADLPRLEAPPRASGVRLLGGFDPYLDQRDREVLLPDPARRTALFPAVGRPGVVLADGRLVAFWRARKQGAVLRIALEWFEDATDLGGEPDAIARLRGCDRAVVAS